MSVGGRVPDAGAMPSAADVSSQFLSPPENCHECQSEFDRRNGWVADHINVPGSECAPRLHVGSCNPTIATIDASNAAVTVTFSDYMDLTAN